jgi:putative Mn2+ efflux pump MntP
MDFATVLFIAVGLAMDAFAVSVARGLSAGRFKTGNALKMAVSFGSFQAFMPLLGWMGGLGLRNVISGVDHWVAFTLLGFIGCKMIYESVRLRVSEKEAKPLNVRVLLVLSVATSIDALAVGLSFAFLQTSITIPIIIIGTVTFILSFLGASFGSKLGRFFENKIEIAGGLILIGIGIKILVEHVV